MGTFRAAGTLHNVKALLLSLAAFILALLIARPFLDTWLTQQNDALPPHMEADRIEKHIQTLRIRYINEKWIPAGTVDRSREQVRRMLVEAGIPSYVDMEEHFGLSNLLVPQSLAAKARQLIEEFRRKSPDMSPLR